MRQILPPDTFTKRILGKQKIDSAAPYRLTTHCVRLQQPEGVLLYHTLTGELLLLESGEAELLEGLSSPVPAELAELVPCWFLVPEGADDMALVDQVRDIARRLERKDGTLTEYMIFTTTACNARCFYCFEAGIKKATMSEETALAAGKYIADHCGGKPVHLVWFGGEPLVNVRAIDVITGCLRQRGVEFTARMVSNAYLFDEELARRAKEFWGLYEVQITLDGTEEVYNQRKAYVAPQGSPFQRVLRNIGLLLDAGIPVRVRLNMDEENERDLYALVDQLAERFAGDPGFGIYFRVLIENKGVVPSAYTEEERNSLAEKAKAISELLDKKGIMWKWPLKRHLILYSCRSDNVNAATITPEGRLGRCETTCERGLWGSVFSEERDEQVLRQWRERRPPEEICRACALYPRCVRLKECVIRTDRCSPIERMEKHLRLQQTILSAYEEWRAGRPAQADTV